MRRAEARGEKLTFSRAALERGVDPRSRQERLDESQAEFEAVLRIDPKSPIARQAIDAIVARRKATGK